MVLYFLYNIMKAMWFNINEIQSMLDNIITYDIYVYLFIYRSSTTQGGGGSFKNRKPIGEVGCCESGMAERIH